LINNIKKYDRGPFDRNSLDQNCVLSLDQNFDNQLTEFFDTFHLIESFNNDFGQTPKFKAFDRIIRSTAKIRKFFFGT
jgi:hypothetical protein